MSLPQHHYLHYHSDIRYRTATITTETTYQVNYLIHRNCSWIHQVCDLLFGRRNPYAHWIAEVKLNIGNNVQYHHKVLSSKYSSKVMMSVSAFSRTCEECLPKHFCTKPEKAFMRKSLEPYRWALKNDGDSGGWLFLPHLQPKTRLVNGRHLQVKLHVVNVIY